MGKESMPGVIDKMQADHENQKQNLRSQIKGLSYFAPNGSPESAASYVDIITLPELQQAMRGLQVLLAVKKGEKFDGQDERAEYDRKEKIRMQKQIEQQGF